MKKSKIAISLDMELLDSIDNYMYYENLTSRSHAITKLLKKSIKYSPVSQAILLIKEKDQKYLFEKFNDLMLLQHNLNFLSLHGIKEVYLITRTNQYLNKAIKDLRTNIKFQLVNEKNASGTASALLLIKNSLKTNFVVMNADTFNDFNLKNMIKEHLKDNLLATIGLITSNEFRTGASSVILDGKKIVDIRQQLMGGTNIINAGIYILNNEIFNFYNRSTKSLEADVFPKIIKAGRVQGIFTFGRFIHIPDRFIKMSLSEMLDRMTIVKLKIERLGTGSLKAEYEAYKNAIREYKNNGVKIKEEWFSRLYDINKKIWNLELDIRSGKEGKLGLEEVGRRAIAIRDLNKKRVSIKNEVAEATGLGFKDIKIDHASQ